MSRVILSSIIAGIVMMLSISLVPVNADPVDNNCLWNDEEITLYCRKALSDGQHSTLNIISYDLDKNKNPGCHYDVEFFNGDWFFIPTNYSESKCEVGFVFDPIQVIVRGT